MATVLFLMALPLEARAVWRTLRRPLPPLLASVINLGLLPLLAWAVAQLLTTEMRLGLYVAAATPSTLASAAVWTRRAGGNDAVAILTTILTNLSCFLVTPLWLLITTGQGIDSDKLQLPSMALKLALVVVLPMALAQLVRRWGAVGQWATARRTALSVAAQCGILSMVLMGAAKTGASLQEAQAPSWAAEVAGMVVAVLGIHLTMFFAGLTLAAALGCSRADRIAVGFSGSQKTLMVGLQVAMDLQFTILPMVSYHVGQLLVDTLIADRLRASADE